MPGSAPNVSEDSSVNIPSIAIISESSQNVVDTYSPVDGLLSPTSLSPRRASLEVPPSPIDDGSSITPSSPTLSNRSSLVHFKNSTDLRDNDPEHPSHHRKLSNATFTSDITEPDAHNSDLVPRLTMESGLTVVDRHEESSPKPPDSFDPKKSKSKKNNNVSDEHSGMTTYQIELEQDRDVDPAPFAFRPFQLAHTLDSKNFDAISAFDGTAGLLRGLGTNAKNGLSKQAVLSRSHSAHNLPGIHKGAGLGASQRHQPQLEMEMVPAITVTSPDGPTTADIASMESSEDDPAYHASIKVRQRIYGENLLPTRPSKTVWQLMWLALKDKVLILLSIAAVISLALGLFQDFGTPRTPGNAPVDWVEGVAIMVAVLIVVSFLFFSKNTIR
jgi:P-type Ca2+ transporter type 2C